MQQPLGDLGPEEFKESAHYLVDWLTRYLSDDSYPEPVLSQVKPGEIAATQPSECPEKGQPP